MECYDIKVNIDIDKYAESFLANFSSTWWLKKGYIGYKDGILVIPNKLSGESIKSDITKPFHTLIFQEGCNRIRFTVPKELKTLIFPDSFSSLFDVVIGDGLTLERLRLPKKIADFPNIKIYKQSFLECFPNLKVVSLPVFYNVNFCRQIIGSGLSIDGKAYKGQTLIIDNCLYAIDEKDEVFYVPENVTSIYLQSLKGNVKTIIVSPNVKAANFKPTRISKLEVYCPNTMESIYVNNFETFSLYFGGSSSELSSVIAAEPSSINNCEIITNDNRYIGMSIVPYKDKDKKKYEFIENLFKQKYQYKERVLETAVTKDYHYTDIKNGRVEEAENIWIDFNGKTYEKTIGIPMFKHMRAIHIDKQNKNITFAIQFPFNGLLMSELKIYYDGTKEEFEASNIRFLPSRTTDYLKIIFKDSVNESPSSNRQSKEEVAIQREPTAYTLSLRAMRIELGRGYDIVFKPPMCECESDNTHEGITQFYSEIKFPDIGRPFFTHYFDKDDEIEDNIEHDFISPYYVERYCSVGDFDDPTFEEKLSLSNDVRDEVLEDYQDLLSLNPSFKKYEDDEILDLLNKIKVQTLIPAVSNEESYAPQIMCFITIKNVTLIPFLLLIAIHKVLFRYDDIRSSFIALMSHSFVWKKNNKVILTMYKGCGRKEAEQISNFSYDVFDEDYIGMK